MKFGKSILQLLAAAALALGSAPATLAADNDLGSGPDAAAFFTKDYAKAVDAAYPRFDSARLTERLEAIRKLPAAQLDPLKLRTLPQLESALQVARATPRKGSDYVSNDQYAARMEAASGRVRLVKKSAALLPVAYDEAARVKERVGKDHQEFLAKIGLDQSQILFLQTGLTSLRDDKAVVAGDTAPAAPRNDQDGALVDGVFTYALRSVDGIMVEGSVAKLTSAASGELIGVDLRWPALAYHPALRSLALKDADTMKKAILAHVEQAANGEEVSVQMAVVLRPVKISGRRAYVPALRVGMLPRTSEGEMFFVDLPRQALKYDADNLADTVAVRSVRR